MKKLQLSTLLSITLLASTQQTHSMHIVTKAAKAGLATLCSAAEGMITFAPLMNETLYNPASIRGKKLQNVESDAPEIITDFITNIAQERTIDNVKVCLNGDAQDYGTEDNGKIIYIPGKYAHELEQLLKAKNTSSLSDNDQQKLYSHTAAIHHELTHIKMRSLKNCPKYDALIGTIGGLGTSIALTQTLKKYTPTITNNFWLRNTLKIPRGILAFYIAFNLMTMNLYKKYDELKADDGIPNQRELLESQLKFYEGRHDNILQCVDIVKKYPLSVTLAEKNDQFNRAQIFAMKVIPMKYFETSPLLCDITFQARQEHPSDLKRKLRFERKIVELDKTSKKIE